MNTIKQLPQDVISKIAAGEVIERPVYAVKELVENAIDAHATSIIINIEQSGLQRITVIDNGMGMSKDDLQEAWKPHATSKLRAIDELTAISTLGFRGEALASIAAISRLTIQSKRKNDSAGSKIEIHDGVLLKTSSVGMPVGTQITVEHLFHSVPVRKKFLKSARTEFRHIIETVMQFAFVHTDIHFVLTHDGKTIFDLPKSADPLDRIQTLLGKDIYASLLPIDYSDSYITLSGFLARPQMTTKTPHKQYLFVNKRTIGDKGMSLAIKSAYGTLIEKQSYPICLLFVSLPPEIVDINVHPKKEEVRFVNQTALYETIQRAVTQSLTKHDLVFHNSSWEKSVYDGGGIFKSRTDSYAGQVLRDQSLPWSVSEPLEFPEDKVMQIHNLYLLVETKKGMVMIDQHAAHERIRYEQILATFAQKQTEDTMHTFSKPHLIELSVSEQALWEEHREIFETLGFALDHFKGRSFLLQSVPTLLYDRDPQVLISEVLENLRMNVKVTTIDAISKKIIAYIACRGAIKAGDPLTQKQSRELIKELEKTENNATCPHGRPTKVVTDLQMINTMFKR